MTDSIFKSLIVVILSAAVALWYHETSQGIGRFVPFNPGYTILDTTTGALYHKSEKDLNGVYSWVQYGQSAR